jgi:CRISPR/Cas system endoribonuclease Cas6 (RAMP superfamily)
MNFDKPFWKTVFREADGTASSARLLTATIIVAALLWVTFLVIKNHVMPDLQPASGFVGGTTLSLYGVNKGGSVLSDIFGKIKGVTNSPSDTQ